LAWLTYVLERMVSGQAKAHELERLLPWAWKAERRAAAVHALHRLRHAASQRALFR
jgi:hypothetical protein